MALRLQDSEEDKTHFVRGLPGPYRAFYFWLKRACDHAGVWEIDIDEARMRTGFFDLDADTAAEVLSKKVIKLPCGEKFFLIDFAAEQLKTTELNYANTYHRGVINIFNKLDIFTLISTYKLKPLQSGFEATKDKEIDKDKFIDKSIELEVSRGKAKKMPKKEETAKTFLTPLVVAFREFKEMRVKIKKPLTERAIQMIHTKLEKLAPGNDNAKVLILNQSVLNCWQDVYELKTRASETKEAKGKVVDMSTVAQYKPIEA